MKWIFCPFLHFVCIFPQLQLGVVHRENYSLGKGPNESKNECKVQIIQKSTQIEKIKSTEMERKGMKNYQEGTEYD